MTLLRALSAALLALSSVACSSSDPTGAGGEGRVSFTTWGEEYIEEEIPGDSFVDGWTVRYEKFLVNFQNIRVADARDNEAALMESSLLFDNHEAGVKNIIEFPSLEAKAWTHVGYEIAPVAEETERSASATGSDFQLMLEGGYSIYVAGTARKGDVFKHFAWGFAIGTKYAACHSEQDGTNQYGIVVTNNGAIDVQLTTHGDHLFYDRLQASPDPEIVTSLRFDALAASDADEDGELTLSELNAVKLDYDFYDPSGLDARNYGAFVTELARTVGHFRGEGECTISEL